MSRFFRLFFFSSVQQVLEERDKPKADFIEGDFSDEQDDDLLIESYFTILIL